MHSFFLRPSFVLLGFTGKVFNETSPNIFIYNYHSRGSVKNVNVQSLNRTTQLMHSKRIVNT